MTRPTAELGEVLIKDFINLSRYFLSYEALELYSMLDSFIPINQEDEKKVGSANLSFQSAGHTTERWLGPDILERLRELQRQGKNRVLVSPIGFVSEHLEILYDVDVEAMKLASELGMKLHRTELPNNSPQFIQSLASLVTKRLEKTAATATATQLQG